MRFNSRKNMRIIAHVKITYKMYILIKTFISPYSNYLQRNITFLTTKKNKRNRKN
jgi:ribosomal protein S18